MNNSNEIRLKMIEVTLEDKIRLCKQSMKTCKGKGVKNEIKIYNEILSILKDF